jgi:hypothetical protein
MSDSTKPIKHESASTDQDEMIVTSESSAIKSVKEEDPVNEESDSDYEEGDTVTTNKSKKKSKKLPKTAKKEKEESSKEATKKPIKPKIQEKILAYFGQELESDRTSVPKQEVAEGCGYTSAGAHPFFYSWQDLEKEKKWITKAPGKMFCLTEEGKQHIPKGIVLVAKTKDNASKQQSFLKILLKQCNEAKAEKCDIVFRILSDGEWHGLDEFTNATGYANLKSKGLGYPFTHMEKKMKILEKNANKEYRFTDKMFPEGRP